MEKWQQDEMRREDAVRKAVMAGDRIILDASEGSVEETDYLTARVAVLWAQKVEMASSSALHRKELMERSTVNDATRRNPVG